MARKSNLASLIERLPESKVVVLSDTMSEILATEDIVLRRFRASREYPCRDEVIFQRRVEGFFIGRKLTRLVARGGRVFTKSEWLETVVLEGGRCSTKKAEATCVSILFSIAGIKWAEELYKKSFTPSNRHMFLLPSVVKGILFGKIRSLEDVYRFYARSNGIKTIDWRLFRDYLDYGTNISLSDLVAGTTDYQEAMRYCIGDWGRTQFLRDIIEQAVILGRKVNPRWSEKRMRAEHSAMTRELMHIKMGSLSSSPIYPEEAVVSLEEQGVRLLNTEDEVYREALVQSHCLYSNYLGKINEHRYVPFHISRVGEEATFGVIPDGKGSVTVDQVQLSHNRCPSDSMKKAVREFVQRHAEALTGMLAVKSPMVADENAELPF